ncbi:MAG: hypothetical protein L0G70_05855 [Rubrobacter sp.]|nr:hypothetical protein [Rubrobacter sp.]
MSGNVWLTFLAELWVAGIMGYMVLSLGRGSRGLSGGGDAAFSDVTLALAAVAAVALVIHASALVAGFPV